MTTAPTAEAGPVTGLQGDEVTEALIPAALDLVTAVHTLDDQAVAAAFDAAAVICGDQLAAAQHLAVIAAGMCSETAEQMQMLGWTLNPDRYRQLTDDGVDSVTASLRAARRGTRPTSDGRA